MKKEAYSMTKHIKSGVNQWAGVRIASTVSALTQHTAQYDLI